MKFALLVVCLLSLPTISVRPDEAVQKEPVQKSAQYSASEKQSRSWFQGRVRGKVFSGRFKSIRGCN